MAEPTFLDLRAFLAQLRRDHDLAVVEAPVDRHLEAAEIHRRVIAAGGPALLFTDVRDSGLGTRDSKSQFRLVTNLFGTARRAELAFGERPLRLIRRIVELAETLLPPTPAKVWGARDVGLHLLKVGTRKVQAGPVVENVTSEVNLDRLPVITCWPEDGGPFITLPLVFTTHPDRPGHNLGVYRMQVYDGRTTGMHWQIGKGGGFHYAAAEARGATLPVTVFLGGPPALILSAIAPLPENVPELMLASLIAGERLPQVHGYGPHPLVANAEFALLGTVPPRVRKPEGPFGDHYGREAMASAFRILGEGQLSLTKFLLLTDRHVDLRNFKATLEHLLARTHPETDLYVFSNLSMDTLDYTGPAVNRGSKGVWLGLGDQVRELPREFSQTPPAGATDVRVFCAGCLVVGGPPYGADPGAADRFASDPAFKDW